MLQGGRTYTIRAPSQVRQEAVSRPLKVDLAVICTKADLLHLFPRKSSRYPVFEAQAAGEGHVGTEIHHHMKPQDLPVKVLDRSMSGLPAGDFQLHKISPFLKRIVLPGLTAVWTAPCSMIKLKNHTGEILRWQSLSIFHYTGNRGAARKFAEEMTPTTPPHDGADRPASGAVRPAHAGERYLSDETPTTSQDEAFIRR